MKNYLEAILKKQNISFTALRKIQGEASTRGFFRITNGQQSMVAMVYPEQAAPEIDKIVRITHTYQEYGLHVPIILDRLEDRVLLLEDLGNNSVQKVFSSLKNRGGQKRVLLRDVADMLLKLKSIPLERTNAVLDAARMKWEMDFFITHFAQNFLPTIKSPAAVEDLRLRLHGVVDRITPIDTFAHRDFHSRNMLLHNDKIYLVDFQDSLKASPYYDLASFAFDCYLDLQEQREFLLQCLAKSDFIIDEDLLYLTALQRNIKALGTFGYQLHVRENMAYKKYIPRTLRFINANRRYAEFLPPELFALE